jgi:hypothetical protein
MKSELNMKKRQIQLEEKSNMFLNIIGVVNSKLNFSH